MKKLRLKQWVKNAMIISSFYLIIFAGVLLVGARNEKFEQQKSANQVTEFVSTINN